MFFVYDLTGHHHIFYTMLNLHRHFYKERKNESSVFSCVFFRYYKQLLADNMIAQRVIQEKIYMIEILIEIYFVWVRVPSFSQQGKCGCIA